MSQTVIYKGITVKPVERSSGKVCIQTNHPGDAQKADIPFKELKDGAAVFEVWVPIEDLVAVDV